MVLLGFWVFRVLGEVEGLRGVPRSARCFGNITVITESLQSARF